MVAVAIEAMGHYKREECLPLVANYLNSNKTILKNVSIKTILGIDKRFAFQQINLMIERGNEMDIANACYELACKKFTFRERQKDFERVTRVLLK